DSGEVLLEAEEIRDAGAAPAVDALVVIADRAEVLVFGGEEADEVELGAAGVLVLVHHDVAIAGAAVLEGLGGFAEQAQGEQDEVVEVHRVGGAKGGFVALAEVPGEGENLRI